jgi:Glucodextranase, domain N
VAGGDGGGSPAALAPGAIVRLTVRLLGLAVAIALLGAPGAQAVSGVAPGAPGARALWTAGNKDGFGTSTTLASKVSFTLGGGEPTEV